MLLQRLGPTDDVVFVRKLIAFVDLIEDHLAVDVDLEDAASAFNHLDDNPERVFDCGSQTDCLRFEVSNPSVGNRDVHGRILAVPGTDWWSHYPVVMRFPWLLLLLCLTPLSAVAQEPTAQLFNGKNLTGWSGDPSHWSVEDGCLVGRSTEANPLERSIYLFSDVEAADFVLEFDYLIEGGNSGMQYRSERLPNDDVAGYQADIEDGPNYSGILYESDGRAIIAQRGERLQIFDDGSRLNHKALGTAEALQAGVLRQEWNHYRVIAKGARLVHEINGVRMIDVLDEESARSRASGIFALQLHQGPPMEVRYRDFKLRNLAEDDAAGLKDFLRVRKAKSGKLAEWIWSVSSVAENEKQWFHYRFELDQPATLSSGSITCDNGFIAWLDSDKIAEGTQWWVPVAVQAGRKLAVGTHDLAVLAWNEGGPAGLAVQLELTLKNGTAIPLTSSEQWRSTPTAPQGWPAMTAESLDSNTWSSVKSQGKVGGPGLVWGKTMAPRVATPVDNFVMPDGFEATLMHTASPSEGSWASMTFGPSGEIYVSPERGKLLRFRFPNGHERAPIVDKLDTPVHSAQGLLYAHNALYANVAGRVGEQDDGTQGDGGLHRLRDLDGDGVFEDHQHLSNYGPPSEHGAHGIVLGPDGMLYVVIGNHTKPPTNLKKWSAYMDVEEDVLLPRIWDPRGHAHGMYAPAAVVMRTDKDATEWELIAGGMRNPYDLAFAPDGELFTYDADMEWDIGTPWYRAPRVVHVIPGSESGWRSGSAKWPSEYPDSLPAVVETGPASPVGITFGTKSHFPQDWADRLYLADWAYGRIITVELSPNGATYSGDIFDFLSGKPLNVTDLEFGPDGALWFTTGGRGTQSGLYRVAYTAPMSGKPNVFDTTPNEDVLLRRKMERDEGSSQDRSDALFSSDRVLRYAARLNLEHKAKVDWPNLILGVGSYSGIGVGELLLASARVGTDRQKEFSLEHIYRCDFSAASLDAKWLLLRTAMLLRTGTGAGETTSPDPELAEFFGRDFPTDDPMLNREIARLLVAVEAPNLPTILLNQLKKATFQEEQLHYATLLRLVETDWTEDQRLWYLTWLRQSHGMPGGLSLTGFLSAIEKDALATLGEEQRKFIEERLPPISTSAGIYPTTQREFHREWTVADGLAALEAAAESGGTAPSLEQLANGKALFRDLSCIQCHRFGTEGGSLGPDLTAVANRFGHRDLLEAIIEPKKAVSDQFTLVPMPARLLNTANEQDLHDLFRFLEAGPQAR